MMIGSSIYRFNESCASQGLQLNYSTSNYLLHYSATLLEPIYNLMKEEFSKSCSIAHGDESFIRLIHKGESKQATMWVKSSALGCGPPYVIFQFSQDRKAQNQIQQGRRQCRKNRRVARGASGSPHEGRRRARSTVQRQSRQLQGAVDVHPRGQEKARGSAHHYASRAR